MMASTVRSTSSTPIEKPTPTFLLHTAPPATLRWLVSSVASTARPPPVTVAPSCTCARVSLVCSTIPNAPSTPVFSALPPATLSMKVQ
jgi:hypothetical protein